MTRPSHAAQARTIAHGEVWTGGRGYASVELPAEAAPLEPPLAHELRDLDPPSSAPHVWAVQSRQRGGTQ